MREARLLRFLPGVASSVVLALATVADAGEAGCRRISVVPARCFDTSLHCAGIPYGRAPCFWVEGRLSAGNGRPTVRLWPIGTHRLLGVYDGAGDPESPLLLPTSIPDLPTLARRHVNSIRGDFHVCPLATELAGWMRPVCIMAARHVVLGRARP